MLNDYENLPKYSDKQDFQGKGLINPDLDKEYTNYEAYFEDKKNHDRQKQLDMNPHFIQLTKGLSPAVLAKVAGQSGAAIQILMFFFENMAVGDNAISVSQAKIAHYVQINKRTVTRALGVLDENEVIGIAKRGNANIYVINPYVAWQDTFRKRQEFVVRGCTFLEEGENKQMFEKFKGMDRGEDSVDLEELGVPTLKINTVVGEIPESKLNKFSESEKQKLIDEGIINENGEILEMN